MGDTLDKDSKYMKDLIAELQHKVKKVKTFAVVINGSQRRFDDSYFKLFEALEFSFGTGFWPNVAVVFTQWFNSSEDNMRRGDEKPLVSKESMTALIRGEIGKMFPKSNAG